MQLQSDFIVIISKVFNVFFVATELCCGPESPAIPRWLLLFEQLMPVVVVLLSRLQPRNIRSMCSRARPRWWGLLLLLLLAVLELELQSLDLLLKLGHLIAFSSKLPDLIILTLELPLEVCDLSILAVELRISVPTMRGSSRGRHIGQRFVSRGHDRRFLLL